LAEPGLDADLYRLERLAALVSPAVGAALVVAHDTWFYWTHRALHDRRWFRAVHGRHHASLHPTPWAAYAFHPVEALVQAIFLPLFLLLVPMWGALKNLLRRREAGAHLA